MTASFGCFKLYYIPMGLRRPVFIHGWAFSSKVFQDLSGVKVNLPAHGHDPEPYRGLESFVERLALSLPCKHDVVGWSLGGSIALMLGLRFPSKVSRIFLVGTSPFFGGAWPERNLRAFKLKIKKEGVQAFRRMAYPREFDDPMDEKEAMKILDDYINLDLRSRLPFLKKKVFIIHGENDPIVPPAEAFKLLNLVKGSKLIILPGGHFPAEDEKGLLSALLQIG